MKIKLLAAALSLNLVACTEGQHKASELKQEASMVETNIENSEPKLDFEYIYNETKGKQRFSREVTKEEENLFYNRILDARDHSKWRFDRRIIEPLFSEEELHKREVHIRALLDQCVALVGPAQKDLDYRLDMLAGEFPMFMEETDDMVYFYSVNPSYLSGRMLKCTEFLYGDDENFKYNHLTNFEYPDPQVPSTAKKQKIEQLYEQIYLEIKAAGLLRKIFFTHYPKSFLRAHADEMGLSKYIKKQEQQGSKLTHGEMAITFFGSREKWIEGFDQFLDQKMINRKIGV